jgi:hypothetical protein
MEIERPPTSTLIKRLRDASRARPRSIGFGRREDEAAVPAMVLVAQVAGLDNRAARAAAAAGAAAIAFALNDREAAAIAAGESAALREAVAACGGAAPGLLFGDAPAPADLAELVESMGVDFAIAGVDRAPAALLGHDAPALVARIDNYSDHPAFLRALGELKVDAILAGPGQPGSGQSALTVFDLMVYKLVVDAVRQPILVSADEAIRPDDLQSLRDVGVDGLIVAVGDRPEGVLALYRDAIARVKVTRRAAPSVDGGPLLPRLSPSAGSSDEGDEDDDE